MSDQPKEEEAVGYKRPPKSGQFKKGESGNPGGRRKKNGPIKVDVESIFQELFSVKVAGQTRTMSAKEVEIRQILKKAIEKKDFRSTAYLLALFEKHGCIAEPENRTSGVISLPYNLPYRMSLLILERYGLPENWTKRQIAWGRKQYEATMTEQERQYEAAGII
ncbi:MULTISPECIES: DUF5681 domain-containing protein [Bradyrhizobium]|uniref:DUF5681 domain-containing protein n=1 Tax=Bradyrhizobium elkanii TaxID=29448 RepID=UPI0003F96846|nr:DUF5681 domain-containing protein [Bradyrhizobium elkanii]